MLLLVLLQFLEFSHEAKCGHEIATPAHASGFVSCLLGFISEAALAGGLIMLANAHLFSLLTRQGGKYGTWFDIQETAV